MKEWRGVSRSSCSSLGLPSAPDLTIVLSHTYRTLHGRRCALSLCTRRGSLAPKGVSSRLVRAQIAPSSMDYAHGDPYAAAAAETVPGISPPGLDEPQPSHERAAAGQTGKEMWLSRLIPCFSPAHFCALLSMSPAAVAVLCCSGGRPGAPSNPDDWVCDGCSNRNYARRSKCNRCQLPKPGFTPPARKFPAGVLSKDAIEKSAGQYKVGDWACAKCGSV